MGHENLRDWTKTDLARVVIGRLQGGIGTGEVPAADHPEVIQLVKKNTKPRLIELAELALGP